MRKALLDTLLGIVLGLAICGGLLAAVMWPRQCGAATIGITDTGCATFSATSDGKGNLTIACGQVQPPPPPPPPPPSGCSGYGKTLQYIFAWDVPGTIHQIYTSAKDINNNSGFSANTVVVVKFTTPTATSQGQYGLISIGEFQSAPFNMIAKLSPMACDVSGSSGTQEPTLGYSVGPNTVGAQILQPGTTYYLNIAGGCNSGCNAVVNFGQPPNL
jgi:hypothetical protein